MCRSLFLIEEAGAQHSQSPAIARGPFGDAATMISKFRSCSSILLALGSYFDAGIIGISRPKGLSGRTRYFVDNQRFISAAMRNRPASSSALLRCCPSGILRASAITLVARASQSRLWAEWADVGLGGEPIMMLSKKSEGAHAYRRLPDDRKG